jgi:uncharacterized protein (DUF983 family)
LPIGRGPWRCPAAARAAVSRISVVTINANVAVDYGFAGTGDGPAVFVILIGGFIVVFAALMTEVVYQPPYWVHAAFWLPLILIVTLVPLRLVKGLLIALQYHHKAAEGRLEYRGDA